MSLIPVAGKKYLVKKPWNTSGCEPFQDDMEKWSKIGVVVESVDMDCQWVWVKASNENMISTHWCIEFRDLIPFKPMVLENK